MTYVALLRGINVGGKNTVAMPQLKLFFEEQGCKAVKTYINSGNVLFTDNRSAQALQDLIEKRLEQHLGFSVKVLIIDEPTLAQIGKALPTDWLNDADMKCDVMFLWADKNTPKILDEIPNKPGTDNVKYVDGALLWCVSRKNLSKSGMLKLVGTPLYRRMTIRNCNTVRKLCDLIAAQ